MTTRNDTWSAYVIMLSCMLHCVQRLEAVYGDPTEKQSGSTLCWMSLRMRGPSTSFSRRRTAFRAVTSSCCSSPHFRSRIAPRCSSLLMPIGCSGCVAVERMSSHWLGSGHYQNSTTSCTGTAMDRTLTCCSDCVSQHLQSDLQRCTQQLGFLCRSPQGGSPGQVSSHSCLDAQSCGCLHHRRQHPSSQAVQNQGALPQHLSHPCHLRQWQAVLRRLGRAFVLRRCLCRLGWQMSGRACSGLRASGQVRWPHAFGSCIALSGAGHKQTATSSNQSGVPLTNLLGNSSWNLIEAEFSNRFCSFDQPDIH